MDRLTAFHGAGREGIDLVAALGCGQGARRVSRAGFFSPLLLAASDFLSSGGTVSWMQVLPVAPRAHTCRSLGNDGFGPPSAQAEAARDACPAGRA